MDHAKRLYLIDEFDQEYKRVQRPSAVIAKARSAVQHDDTLRSSELDDHEKATAICGRITSLSGRHRSTARRSETLHSTKNFHHQRCL